MTFESWNPRMVWVGRTPVSISLQFPCNSQGPQFAQRCPVLPRACTYSFSSALWWLQGVLSSCVRNILRSQECISAAGASEKWPWHCALTWPQVPSSQRADKCHPKLFKGLKALLAHGNSPFSSDTSLWQTLLPHQHICRTKISLPLPCAGPPSSQPHLIIERVPDLLTNKTFIQMTVALLYFC